MELSMTHMEELDFSRRNPLLPMQAVVLEPPLASILSRISSARTDVVWAANLRTNASQLGFH